MRPVNHRKRPSFKNVFILILCIKDCVFRLYIQTTGWDHMLRTEEAGLCAWVLSHTIFFIYVCITLHTVLSVCGHEYGHCHRCVFSLRQSFDQLGLELLRQMLNPPGSCLIPGCSPARLTVYRLSPWLQRWNCSRLYSHMALMSTEEERKREEAGFRHRRAFAVSIKQLACSNTTRISDGNSDRTTEKVSNDAWE